MRSNGRYTPPKKPKLPPVRMGGDPILTRPTDAVTAVNDQILYFAEQMKRTMVERRAIGVAAPQLGRTLAMFGVNVEQRHFVMCNPAIVELSDETSVLLEGCLSFPNLYLELERSAKVHVVGMGLDEEPMEVEANGLLARCILHELDHLAGVVMLKKVATPEQLAALLEFDAMSATPAPKVLQMDGQWR